MNRIVHLALKVEDLEKTTEFYEKVFGFREVETRKTRDHLSRHLSDGAIDFTLIQYDAGTASSTTLSGGTQVVFDSAINTTVDSGTMHRRPSK